MRQRRWMMAVALGAALGADLPADEVAAKRRKKESLSARIDGKLLKASGKHYTDSFTAGIALVQGDTPLRLGKVVRAIAVGCGIDLATSALPVTPVFPVLCTMGYATFSFKGGQGVTKQWAETNVAGGVEVTFESFDGTRVQGTFRGTLAPLASNPGEPPVTVENGKFAAIVGN